MFTHTQTAGGTSLDYALAEGERLDPVTFGMLSNNTIDGICAVRRSQLDEQVVLHLDVAGLEDLGTWTRRHVRQEQVLQVLESLVTTLLSARSYMIDAASFVLDREHVFVDPSAPRAVLVCLPVQPQPQPDVLTFFKDLVINLDYDRTDGAAYMGSLIGYVMSQETLDLTQLSLELRSLQLRMATRSAPESGSSASLPAPSSTAAGAPASTAPEHHGAPATPVPGRPAAVPVAGLPPVPYPDAPAAVPQFSAHQSPAHQQVASAPSGLQQLAPQTALGQPIPPQPAVAPLATAPPVAVQPVAQQPAVPTAAPAAYAVEPAAAPAAQAPVPPQAAGAAPVPAPVARPSTAPAGFAVPGQPGQVAATAPRRPTKRGKQAPGALPAPPRGRLTGPQPAAEEKLMSLAYLLQHYSAENKRVYEDQREARAARKTAKAAAKQTTALAAAGPAVPDAGAGALPAPADPAQPWAVAPVAPFVGGAQDTADPRSAQHAAVGGGADTEGFGGTVVFGQGRHVAPVAPQAPAAATPVAPVPSRRAAALRRVATGEQVAITKDVFVIGRRSPRVDYALRHETVSKSHAIIYADADGYAIVDNRSTNGVLLDGVLLTPMTRQPLHHGVRIHVGDELLEFLLGG